MSKISNEQRYAQLLDRYRNHELDRRTFLGLIGCAGLAAGLVGGPFTGFVRSAAAQVRQIRFDSWGGVVSEALRRTAMASYQKATGITVVEGTFGLESEILAKVKAARPGDYNIINSAGFAWYKRWIDAGWGVVLNEANIPNAKAIMPALMAPFRKITPAGVSAIPFSYGTTGIAYNTKFISHEEAKALAENLLIKKELKGKISGHNDWQTRLWMASLQAGQNPNDIKDLNAVWAKLRESRDLVKKYWNSGAESMELLASEEVYVADMWSGRAAALQDRGLPIGFVDSRRGNVWASDLLVLKGSPVEACEQLINFILDREVAITVAEAQLYPPPFDPTKVPMSDKIKKLPNFDPTGTLSKYDYPDPVYWTENEKAWKPQYERIAQGF